MARVIVITSGKGGVGKTTTTSNIGMALARLGFNTLLVDADVGLRNLDLLLGLENRIIYTGLDVLAETCRLEQALIQDKRQSKLTFFPLSSNQAKTPITKSQIQELICLLKDKYDFILIDSPAGIDDGFQTAIDSANEAIVVVTPEVPSIRDADKVIGILVSQQIKKVSLLVNRIRPKMVKTDDMMSIEDVKNILGIPLVGVIPDSEQVIIASNRGEPLVLEEKLSLPGLAFENTARRLIGEELDFLDLDTTASRNPVRRFFGKIIKNA
ncbi:MAG: septum site-determining protein MinD [Flavobacteriales bacterium]|jgi:septum site-determining protein MinD|nr:septum site-determining protein MinD [Flavobacteriales bacterium]